MMKRVGNFMKIDIWSDFACPFCYIGKRHLEKALENYEDVELVFHSYELDPTTSVDFYSDANQMLADKYGMSYEEAKQNNGRVIDMAKQAGLHYDFEKIKITNTVNAHRVAQFAKTKGLGNVFVEATLHAYFSDGAYLNDEETLVNLGTSVGLDADDVRRVFQSDEFLTEVRQDQAQAKAIGITGVPFFVIDEKYGVSGAQPIAVFEEVLEKVGATPKKATPLQMMGDTQAPGCEDGACEI